jgi:transcriptional regulator
MYQPPYHKETDAAKLRAFIEANAFGILVTADAAGQLLAVHIPFRLRQQQAAWVLRGHVAKANPIWKALDAAREVLCIFAGPHAYISPSWYEAVNVPTWNYLSVHAYGTPRLLNAEEFKQDLAALVRQYEAGRPGAVLTETYPAGYLEQEMRGAVGFEIAITRMEGSWKLSRNRNVTDHANIAQQLRKEDDPGATAIADEMANDDGYKKR